MTYLACQRGHSVKEVAPFAESRNHTGEITRCIGIDGYRESWYCVARLDISNTARYNAFSWESYHKQSSAYLIVSSPLARHSTPWNERRASSEIDALARTPAISRRIPLFAELRQVLIET